MRPLTPIVALCACLAIAFGQSEPPAKSLEHYRNGESFMERSDYQAAANEFRAALNGDLDPKWVEVWSHIDLGKIFELTGQHERALKEFRLAIATGDNTRDAQIVAAAWFELARAAGVEAAGPEPVEHPAPEYSDEARRAGLEGTVLISAVIAEDGSVRDPRVMRSLGLGLDEKALEAVTKWKFVPKQGKPAASTIAVDFVLPDNFSRWHLMRAEFQTPEGATRPVFAGTFYPPGAGISLGSLDEGVVLAAIRRFATVTLSFDVDEHGVPVNFQVVKSSMPLWGAEAISLVGGWRFQPGVKDGVPVSAPCILDLVWGQKQLNASLLAKAREALNPQPLSAQASHSPPVIWHVQPSYTDEARKAKLEGYVELRLLVGADGAPRDIQVLRSLGMGLDEKAVEAVSQWRFQPPLVNGRAEEISTVVSLIFRLSDPVKTTIVLP